MNNYNDRDLMLRNIDIYVNNTEYIKKLEKKYTITISFNGNYYMVFNYFGKLWFTSDTLKGIEKEMKRIYELLNDRK